MEALDAAVKQAKRQEAQLDNEYNAALAMQKQRREQDIRAYEQELSTREVLSQVNGLLLDDVAPIRDLGPGERVRIDSFKGISAQAKQRILDMQEKQRVQNHVFLMLKKEKLEQKQYEEELWAIKEINNQRAVALLERENKRAAKQEALALQKENQLKALTDKQRYFLLR